MIGLRLRLPPPTMAALLSFPSAAAAPSIPSIPPTPATAAPPGG